MEKRSLYRFLLAVVLILTVVYTLGIIGVVPFEWSYYITIFMILLFFALKLLNRGS